MSDSREDLRDELMAMLAASEELPPDVREHVVDAFLAGLQAGRPARHTGDRLTIPVSAPVLLGVALGQGAIIFVSGHWMLDGVLEFPTYAQQYMPAWIVLGVLWLVEVLVTLVVISVLTGRRELEGKTRGKRRKVLTA
jgi:hypothetical protein